MKNIFKRATALLLSLLMVFSVCSTSLVIYAQDAAEPDVDLSKLLGLLNEEKNTINYVSLGDSMTNGYGLEGYLPEGSNGSKNYYGFTIQTPGSYPVLVANEMGWELTQLASSGMRAEDLFYLLNYGTDYEFEHDDYFRPYVDSKFADYVKDNFPDEADDYSYGRDAREWLPDSTHEFIIGKAAEIYQDKVFNADVISLAMGSNNFATLIHLRLGYLLRAAAGTDDPMFGGYSGDFDFDQLMTDFDQEFPTLKEDIAELYAEVEKYLIEAAAENGIDLDTELNDVNHLTMEWFVKDVAKTLTYTTAGFMLGYKGILDTLQRENADAEIIVVALTNWFQGVNLKLPLGDKVFELDMGEMIDMSYGLAGAYMAALPNLYSDMTVYYANTNAEGVEDIELLVHEIQNNIREMHDFSFEDLYAIEDPQERFEAALEIVQALDSSVLPAGELRLRYIEALMGLDTAIQALPALEGVDEAYNAYFENEDYFVGLGFADVWSFVEYAVDEASYSGCFDDIFPLIYNEKALYISTMLETLNLGDLGLTTSFSGMNTYVADLFANNWANIGPNANNPDYYAATLICDKDILALCNFMYNFLVGSGVIMHPSLAGHQTIAEVIIDTYNNKHTATDETWVNLGKFYTFLKEDESMTVSEKVDLLGGIYSIFRANVALDADSEKMIKAVEEISVYLDSNGLITDEQTLDIVLCIYEKLLDKYLSDADVQAIVKFVYETVLMSQADVAVRMSILANIYSILKSNYNEIATNDTIVMLENICKNLEGKVTDLQAFAIVHLVYKTYTNDGVITADEYRDIASIIYFVIFRSLKMARAAINWNDFTFADIEAAYGEDYAALLEDVQEEIINSPAMTPTDKVEIFKAVVDAIPETVIESNPQVEAATDLFDTLTGADGGEKLLTDEQTAAIIESAFTNLVAPDPENVDATQAITNITQTVVENLVGMEPEKFDKVMEAVKETVGNIGSVGGGDSTIPEIVIPEIPKEVKLANELAYIFEEQGVVNAEQRGKLVATLMPMLLGQTVSRSELVLNIYRIVYSEGFSIDKTVDIVIAVATFAYENRIGAMNYANPYYDKAVAKVLTEDNIAFAQAYVSAAKAKVNEAIVALGGTPKAAIESDTTALKAALLAELEATYDTLVKIEEVLNSNALKNGDEYQIQATIAVLLTFEEDLNKHSANINAIATEAGALAMPYIVQAIGAINQYTQIAANVAVAAYEWCVENVQNFKADYIALAKQLSGYAAEIDPAFGTAVYNFMINTPADAMRTIYLYGEGAVDVLIDRSLDYADGVAAAAIELARVIKKYGAKVYSAIRNDATCYGLYAELRGIYAEILALRAQIGLSGIAMDVYRRLDEVTAYGIDVADKFYHAAIQAVKDEDFQAGVELKDAIDGLVTALAAIDNESIDYAEWLVTHAGAMCGAVLAGLIENWNEFAEVSGPIVYKKAIEIYNAVKEYVLNYDYESLIQQVIDAAIKLAPELDAMLYDYFYNNPEEVIAFFNEYGDVIVDLCKKYGTPVLAVIGVALAVSGPELAEYIINNPKEVLEGLSAWADKYGAKVVAILQVYAEALGLCDAVRGEVAELNNKLAALQAELMNQLNILQNELQVELDALYAQLENATEAAKVIILEKIKENESKIELVQKYIAELQAKIAELQVKIAEINAKLQALINALYNLDDALKALLETGTESGVAAVQKALNEVANAVRDVIGVISGDIAAQIDKLLQKVEDYLNDAYHSAIIADYVINSNSSYVALGDNEEYAKLFAQYLKDTVAVANVGYNYKVNTALVQNGSKISTLPVIINENLGTIAAADLISIGYSFDKVAEDTILMAIELLMDGKTSVPTDYDWATIAGAEAAAEIEKLVGEIYTYMLNEGLGITVSEATSGMFDHNVTIADIAIIAVQYFVYNVVEYAAYLPQAVNAISQINPDAIIMINSISNPISGAKVSFFGEELVFGDYLDYVCDAMFVETAVLAAIYENVVFVPTTEIETTFTNRTISFNSSKDFIALAELLTALMENQAINTTPNGNAYACQKMTEALNITVEDGGLLGDVNGDGVVDYIDAILILRYEVGFVDPKFIAGVADVDRDGYIGYVDAIWVLKYEAGLEKEFPASK